MYLKLYCVSASSSHFALLKDSTQQRHGLSAAHDLRSHLLTLEEGRTYLARKEANCEIRHGEGLSVGVYMSAISNLMSLKAYVKFKQVSVKKLLFTKIL
jgi:hypothetical protein